MDPSILDEDFLPDKIRHFRKARGWSQEKLAAESGVSTRTVSRLEAGEESSHQSETLRKVSRALGVGLEELFMPPETESLPGNLEALARRVINVLLREIPEISVSPELCKSIREAILNEARENQELSDEQIDALAERISARITLKGVFFGEDFIAALKRLKPDELSKVKEFAEMLERGRR